MTPENRQLLLKDLCGRLPYGVKVQIQKLDEDKIIDNEDFGYMWLGMVLFDNPYHQVKPYLRPMSSMTEDEREEIEVFIFNKWYEEDSCKIDKEGWIEILANYDVSGIDPCFCSDYVDWLNEHHFDFRGLIEKGLALEAPEEMYKTE